MIHAGRVNTHALPRISRAPGSASHVRVTTRTADVTVGFVSLALAESCLTLIYRRLTAQVERSIVSWLLLLLLPLLLLLLLHRRRRR
jgi:hypothetical protein